MKFYHILILCLSVGCAAAPPPAASAPPAPAAAPRPAEKEPTPGPRVVEPAAVPPPPAACVELARHPVTGCAKVAGPGGIRRALALALEQAAVAPRDAALACLEAEPELPPGLVRALRAELGPEECADALVTPLVESPPKGMSREVESLLLGLVVSGRLARLLADPPRPTAPVTKQSFREFFAGVLTPWVLAQAAAIEKLSLTGARLSGYGRGVAAIAAGNADLRFVDMVRDVPLPDEMKADKAVESAYFGALDEALEPRKIRGRDAALVGLRAFAEVGALHDPRVERARALLTKLWSGSRVDALDRLLIPEPPALDLGQPVLSLAARLPTFHAGELLADEDGKDPKFVRALLERGIPTKLRAKLDGPGIPSAVRILHARALLESGRRYFRARDFAAALALLAKEKLGDEGKLLAALAQALTNGPEDAAELMLKGPFVKGTGDVSALDAEVARNGRYAGHAAFDAAFILSLAPQPEDPKFWDALAARYVHAEKLLVKVPRAEAAVAEAIAQADAARATAASLRKH